MEGVATGLEEGERVKPCFANGRLEARNVVFQGDTDPQSGLRVSMGDEPRACRGR